MQDRTVGYIIADHLQLDDAHLEERLRFLRLGPEDALILRLVYDRLGPVPSTLSDEFYRHILSFPEPRKLLERHGVLERLQQKQKEHFASMLRGPWDRDYAVRRLEVGYVHHIVGVEPAWYVGAFSHYLLTLQNIVIPLCHGDMCVDTVHNALTKVVLFDMTLGLEAYHYAKYVETKKLEQLALTDGLTGLANRRALDQASRRGLLGAGAVLFVDIDHFKAVNDQYGHATGDAVLQELAARLGRTLRSTDAVFRYGGEEYLVVLSSLDAQGAWRTAEKIRQAVASAPLAGVPCTVSVGGAVVRAGEDFWQAVRRADAAMYAAKAAGRNRVVMDASGEGASGQGAGA